MPHLLPIIEQLNTIVLKAFKDNNVSVIDKNNNVHMANMAIHFGYSVNGVAQLHTDILKDTELNHFYKLYPEKFNNKTNGITFRRWLLSANPELTQLIDKLIGQNYKKDAHLLKNLTRYTDDETVLSQLDAIKTLKKKQLADFLNTKQGIELDTKSIFDIQIKRLHEYKRQQLNLLYIIDKYLKIKQGEYPKRPITFIFGAKAAPAYTTAKDIIHLALTLSDLIDQDDEVNRYIKLVMVENYNVTNAEKLIPACDISEQISLASKEASGTGNMKFMLNGALTLGTLDGANVEIEQLVGRENIYIFGETSEQVIQHYQNQSYNAETFYKDPAIRPLVDFIESDQMLALGDKEKLTRLRNNLVYNDYFMALLDLKDYIVTKEKMLDDYEDRKSWVRKSLINIANAGFFSSDRTIEEYNKDIWKLNG